MKIVINYTFLAVLSVCLLAMTGDSTMTWTSPMFEKLKSTDPSINPLDRPITEEEDGWIGSLINIGAMIGPFFYGWISEKVGRKIALLSIAVPHLIAYLTMSFARNINLFYFARLLAGIAVGGGYTLMPMYIAEISEDSNRGMFSVTLNVFWTFGNFIPYVIGPFLSAMYFNLCLSCLPAIFFITFYFVAPETPYYLIRKNQIEKAEDSLMLLRTHSREAVQKDIEVIRTTLANEKQGTFMDLFKTKAVRKALIISLLLIMFQQLSGINAFLFYTQSIFDASGSDLAPDISSIIVGAVLFLSSFITPFLADRLGRKLLLIVSSIGVTIALLTMGAFFYIHDKTDINDDGILFLPLLCFVLFIITFNLGIGPVPWTVSSELFPSNVRSYAASATSATCWLTSFVVTVLFNTMNGSSMGRGGTFWFYAGTTTLAGLFSVFYVPETKNRSFDEIQRRLES